MKIFSRVSGRQLWRLLLVATIIWGCLLRFYKIDGSLYWEDETFTSLRLSGYSNEELIETAFQGEVVYPEDLLQFQIVPVERSLGDMVNSLTDDTHPPGYFVLLRLWTHWFGRSVASVRSLSAAVSLLLLPGVFGLAWMLFERSPQRRAIAELSTALVAVSPYQIALANEARMYSLLPVATTLAGLCLLRAIRTVSASRWQRGWQWGWYGLTSAASLYVHWFAVPILAGYGLYVWLQSQAFRSAHWARAQKRYLLMAIFAASTILPWVLFMGRELNNVYYQTRWAGEAVSFWGGEESLGQLWLQHALMLFLNVDIFSQVPLLKWASGAVAIAFTIWALIYLVRHTALPVWSFLLISGGIIYTPLAIVDIFFGGRRSGIFRYFSPSLGAIEISVAFCLVSLSGIALLRAQSHQVLSHQAQSHQVLSHQQDWLQTVARGAIAFLLIGGVLSQTVAKVTYAVEQQPLGQVASAINQTPNALLVSDAPRPSMLLPLAHLLKAQTPLMLTVRPEQPVVEEIRDRPVFLYLPSEAFQASLKAQGNRLRPVAGATDLFSVEPEMDSSRQAAARSL